LYTLPVISESYDGESYEGLFYKGSPVLHEVNAKNLIYSINKFGVDNHRRLWVAALPGLYWFDGYDYHEAINQNGDQVGSHGKIANFLFDADGGLWYLTLNGKIGYYSIDKSYELFLPNDSIAMVNDITLLASGGSILAATESGFKVVSLVGSKLAYDDANFLSSDKNVQSMILQKDVLLYADKHRLYQQSVTGDKTEHDLGFSGFVDSDIFVDDTGAIWFEEKKKLIKFQAGKVVFELAGCELTDMIQAKDGNLWLGVVGKGLWVMDPASGAVLKQYDVKGKEGLAINADLITSLFEDHSGIIWISRFSQLIMKINPDHQVFSNITVNPQSSERSITHDSIFYLLQHSSGNIWIAYSSGGVSVMSPAGQFLGEISVGVQEGGSDKKDLVVSTLPEGSVYALLEDENSDVWASVRGEGVYRIDNKSFRVSKEISMPGSSNKFFNLLIDKDNRMIISGREGVFEFDREKKTLKSLFDFSDSNISPKTNHTVLGGDDNVWVGGSDYIGAIARGDSTFSAVLTRFDLEADAGKERFVSLFRGEGANVYMIHGNVLYSLKLNRKLARIDVNKVFDGTSKVGRDISGRYYELVGQELVGQELAGRELAGQELANKEVVNIELSSPFVHLNLREQTARFFSRSEGIFPGLDYYFARLKLSDGTQVHGSADGLVVFRPWLLEPWDLDVAVVLSSVQTDGKPYKGSLDEIIVESTVSALTVAVSALDYTSPEKNRYAFRMLGYQDEWLESDYQGRRFSLSNISAGRYLLEIKGSNRNGVWGSTPLRLTVVVLPKWYETYWFRGVVLLIVFAALYLLYRIRVAQLRQRQQLLELTVDARTSELKSSLDELQLTKSQLVESEKQASLGRLVRGVAHELNTPIGILISSNSVVMSGVSGLQQSFKSGGLTEAGLLKYFQSAIASSTLMSKNIERMANLTQRFKQSVGEDADQHLIDFPVLGVVEQCVKLQQVVFQGRAISVNIQCDRALSLYSYPNVLRDVLSQLIENSMQHGFKELSPEFDPKITIKVRRWRTADIKILFADNGEGMDQDVMAEAFEPFFTSSIEVENVGLGLHSVFNKVSQSLRGQISCRAQHGKGSLFVLKLKNHPKPGV